MQMANGKEVMCGYQNTVYKLFEGIDRAKACVVTISLISM